MRGEWRLWFLLLGVAGLALVREMVALALLLTAGRT